MRWYKTHKYVILYMREFHSLAAPPRGAPCTCIRGDMVSEQAGFADCNILYNRSHDTHVQRTGTERIHIQYFAILHIREVHDLAAPPRGAPRQCGRRDVVSHNAGFNDYQYVLQWGTRYKYKLLWYKIRVFVQNEFYLASPPCGAPRTCGRGDVVSEQARFDGEGLRVPVEKNRLVSG